MTEPTSNQLKEARKISEALSILSAKDIAVFIAHIRREARNAALDKAAIACVQPNNFIPDDCAAAIRALKDQP